MKCEKNNKKKTHPKVSFLKLSKGEYCTFNKTLNDELEKEFSIREKKVSFSLLVASDSPNFN